MFFASAGKTQFLLSVISAVVMKSYTISKKGWISTCYNDCLYLVFAEGEKEGGGGGGSSVIMTSKL